MRIVLPDRKLLVSSAVLVVLALGATRAYAQFAAPTCTPPNCSPAVIQNIPIGGTSQNASINVTGDAKLGATLQAGISAPVLNASSQNLYYGNVGASSSAGSLMLLQNGGVDRFRVDIAGNETVLGVHAGPLGTVLLPSYTFIGDTNTGMYSPGADQIGFTTGGAQRLFFNNNGTTVSSGQLFLPTGSAAAPSLTFAGDTNTGIYRSAADTFHFVTNSANAMTVSSTGTVIVPGTLVVQTALIAPAVGGNGSGITNINADNITSGTLNDARLSPNVALLNRNNQIFTGSNTFSSASNAFTGTYSGNGAGITSLNASNIASGTLGDSRLSSNVALKNASNVFTSANTFAGMTTLGSSGLVTNPGENVLYGSMSTDSSGNLMLLQQYDGVSFNDAFRVDKNGNASIAGTMAAASATVAGKQVCLADGTNCLVSGLNGTGTANFVPKYTASATLGNSQIQDNGSGVGLGGAPNANKLEVYGTAHSSGFTSNTATGAAVSGIVTANAGTTNYGVYGNANGAAQGYGVYGYYNGTNASGYGVYGRSDASSGTGVYGQATGLNGVGGFFYANSAPGIALRAQHALSGTAIWADGNMVATGNLTIDTNTLFADAAANNVGIGTLTPLGKLHVVDNWDGSQGALTLAGDKPTIRFDSTQGAGSNEKWLAQVGSSPAGSLGFYEGTDGSAWNNRLAIAPHGTLTVTTAGTNWNEGIEINPSTANGYNALYFRQTPNSITNSWFFGRVASSYGPLPNGLAVIKEGLNGMVGTTRGDSPLEISQTGNIYFGGTVNAGNQLSVSVPAGVGTAASFTATTGASIANTGIFVNASSGSPANYGVFSTVSGGGNNYAYYATATGANAWGIWISAGGAAKPGGGSWAGTSDARVKKDVRDFTDGLNVIRQFHPVGFKYNGAGGTSDDGTEYIGAIAQEVQKIAPYMVFSEKKKLHETDPTSSDILYLDPSALAFINANATKELDLRIDGFEAKVIQKNNEQDEHIRALERELANLKKRLEDLERSR